MLEWLHWIWRGISWLKTEGDSPIIILEVGVLLVYGGCIVPAMLKRRDFSLRSSRATSHVSNIFISREKYFTWRAAFAVIGFLFLVIISLVFGLLWYEKEINIKKELASTVLLDEIAGSSIFINTLFAVQEERSWGYPSSAENGAPPIFEKKILLFKASFLKPDEKPLLT